MVTRSDADGTHGTMVLKIAYTSAKGVPRFFICRVMSPDRSDVSAWATERCAVLPPFKARSEAMPTAEFFFNKSQQCRRLMKQTADGRAFYALQQLAQEYDLKASALRQEQAINAIHQK